MKKVTANAIEHHLSYLEVMRSPEATGLDVSAGTQKRLRDFAQFIDELGMLSDQLDAFAFADHVLRTTGIQTVMALDRSPEGIDRSLNVQEFDIGPYSSLSFVKEPAEAYRSWN